MSVLMAFETINGVARVTWRETIDRNGPGMAIEFVNKNDFRSAFNRILAQGDEEIIEGDLVRTEDRTNVPIALFDNEADADAFLLTKGVGFRKDTEPGTLDGYDFKIVRTG